MNFDFEKTYKVEDFIFNTKWEKLPENIKRQAIICGIDLINALILGSKGNQYKIGVNFAKKYYKDGDIDLIGREETLNLPGAIVAYSHASNSFDIDDGFNLVKGHPGTSFIAGVISSAIQENISYKEFLETIVVCYELSIREGLALQDHYNYLHSTGAYGAFGTAAGICKILKLDKEKTNNALSIADFHAPLTPVMRSVQNPSMNKDGVPFGALIGMQSVLETIEGSEGEGYLLELAEYEEYVNNLDRLFMMVDLYFKPYTCCRWAHQPIEASIDLIKDNDLDFNKFKEVKVFTFDSAAQLSKIKPKTTDEAQYNIAWPVASAIVHGDVGIEQVIESALNDENVLKIMDILKFEVDKELDAAFPEKRLAKVQITTKDGKTYASDVYQASGESTDNVDINWIKNKFIKRTKNILKEEGQKEILDNLENNLNIKMKDLVTLINNQIK